MKKPAFLLFILFISSRGFTQDMDKVRENIDSLTSPAMHGRGAENNGEGIAARYIASLFKQYGLQPIKNSFFQNFSYDINTFPGKMQLLAGNDTLVPGKDFIVNGASGSGTGKAKVYYIDSTSLNDEKKLKKLLSASFKGKAIVLSASVEKPFFENAVLTNKLKDAAALIVLKTKLTEGLSSFKAPFPYFEVLKTAFPKDEKCIHYSVDAVLQKDYNAANIIGYVPGTAYPDSFLVISAHYDHLGQMGKDVYFPGANDNASGVSMMLALARYYAENPAPFSIAFMAFGAEEAGLIGSRYYVEHPLFPLKQIRFLINLDLLGTGEEGIMVVNGKVLPEYYDLLTSVNAEGNLVPEIKKRGEAANSDHYFFYKKGVPAFFIYTMGGITAYHDVYDRPETLPLTEFSDVFTLLKGFLSKIQKL